MKQADISSMVCKPSRIRPASAVEITVAPESTPVDEVVIEKQEDTPVEVVVSEETPTPVVEEAPEEEAPTEEAPEEDAPVEAANTGSKKKKN